MKYFLWCLSFVFVSVFISGGFFIERVDAATCHMLTGSATLKNKVPGFGMPFSVFTATTLSSGELQGNDMIIDADCFDSTARVSFGGKTAARVIYEKGYRLNTQQQQWVEFSMTASQAASDRGETRYQNSDYFVYETQSTIPQSFFDLGNGQGRVYVIAYICENRDGAWRCGCTDKACSGNGNWQIQQIGSPN